MTGGLIKPTIDYRNQIERFSDVSKCDDQAFEIEMHNIENELREKIKSIFEVLKITLTTAPLLPKDSFFSSKACDNGSFKDRRIQKIEKYISYFNFNQIMLDRFKEFSQKDEVKSLSTFKDVFVAATAKLREEGKCTRDILVPFLMMASSNDNSLRIECKADEAIFDSLFWWFDAFIFSNISNTKEHAGKSKLNLPFMSIKPALVFLEKNDLLCGFINYLKRKDTNACELSKMDNIFHSFRIFIGIFNYRILIASLFETDDVESIQFLIVKNYFRMKNNDQEEKELVGYDLLLNMFNSHFLGQPHLILKHLCEKCKEKIIFRLWEKDFQEIKNIFEFEHTHLPDALSSLGHFKNRNFSVYEEIINLLERRKSQSNYKKEFEAALTRIKTTYSYEWWNYWKVLFFTIIFYAICSLLVYLALAMYFQIWPFKRALTN